MLYYDASSLLTCSTLFAVSSSSLADNIPRRLFLLFLVFISEIAGSDICLFPAKTPHYHLRGTQGSLSSFTSFVVLHHNMTR